jgi:hypothetical protein
VASSRRRLNMSQLPTSAPSAMPTAATAAAAAAVAAGRGAHGLPESLTNRYAECRICGISVPQTGDTKSVISNYKAP